MVLDGVLAFQFSTYTSYTIAWASLTLPVAGPMGPMLKAQLRRHSACTNNLPFDDVHIVPWLEPRMQDYSTWFTQIFIQFEQESPKKKSAGEIDTLGLKCKVPGDPGQMQTDLQSQVFESGMPTMARHPKSLAKRKGKGEEFQKKTSAMMGIPVLKIQHAHTHDLKKFMIKPSGLHNFWTFKE